MLRSARQRSDRQTSIGSTTAAAVGGPASTAIWARCRPDRFCCLGGSSLDVSDFIHSKAPKNNPSHGNEVLLQDTTYVTQRPCHNEEVRAKIKQAIGSHEDLLTIVQRRKLKWYGHVGSGQNHLARHNERGKKIRQTEEEVGRQNQGMDRPGVRQVPEGSEEQGKME